MTKPDCPNCCACPWCRTTPSPGEIPEGHYVECVNKHCPVKPETEIYATKAEAVAAWNLCDPEGLRREVETAETKQQEAEAALAVAQGALDGCRDDCSEAVAKLKEGIGLVQDFLHRLDLGEQWEAQMRRCRIWAGGPPEPE